MSRPDFLLGHTFLDGTLGRLSLDPPVRRTREHRRRRFRRHGRRALIRSVYSLPSLATLGNAICGFASIYIVGLADAAGVEGNGATDHLTLWFTRPEHKFIAAAWLIFLAMVFDALDGRLARFARHTTDFGGQLDSLADVISFGAAPAFSALKLFKAGTDQMGHPVPVTLSRLVWSIGALYMSCAAIRLARFNVSNEHGEQHHFSFLGLPSPGAAGAVAALVLMYQELQSSALERLAAVTLWVLPVVVLATGLLMVSTIRYPHLVNRYLRGKKSVAKLVVILAILLLVIVNHTYTLALGLLAYSASGAITWALSRLRRRLPGARRATAP